MALPSLLPCKFVTCVLLESLQIFQAIQISTNQNAIQVNLPELFLKMRLTYSNNCESLLAPLGVNVCAGYAQTQSVDTLGWRLGGGLHLCLWFPYLDWLALVAWVTVSLVDGQLAVAMLMRAYQSHERQRLPVECNACFIYSVTLQGHREAAAFSWKCHTN